MAALVLGVLAVVLGVSIVGGVVLGALALALGMRGTARARAQGGRSGTAFAGAVLGVVGLLIAGGTYLWARGPLEDYRDCRRASVSLAQDRVCREQFQDSFER